ncbi:MAG: hypothetical protein HY587_04460 [Candidatus Omnitrophica bacterium]|nr:hypothetical protein [Candidatus Omnitrophota bacterium]
MPLSRKDKIQIGIIAVFLILGILRVIQVATRTSNAPDDLPAVPQAGIKTPGQPSPAPAATENREAPDYVPAVLNRNSQLERSKQRWGRDPFFGLPIEDAAFEQQASDTRAGELVLTGISLKGKRAMAIVNRTIVREGDEVFGMKVLAIERDRVVFAQNSHEVILRFGGAR